MNAVTRIGNQSVFTSRRTVTKPWSLQSFFISGLLVLVFISAFSVVYARDHQRQLVTYLQGLQIDHDSMVTERSQLLLEQAAWSTQTRVQQVAQTHLGMTFPGQQSIIMVQE